MGILKMRLSDIFLDIKLRAVLFCLCPSSFILYPSSFRQRRGQTTVEYLLMLAVVVGVALTIGILFHKMILGGLFSLVGMVIGAGNPTP